MKLYELERGKRFKLQEPKAVVPPAVPEDVVGQTYTLGAIDGMYSWSIGEDGERYYFAAYTEVEEIEND